MRITPGESIRMSLDSVWAHKFRSGLTILGIVIGITTVVTVSSLLTGLRKGIVTFFEEFGPNTVFAKRFSGDPSQPNGPPKERKRRPMKAEYGDIIKRLCPSVEEVGVGLFIPTFSGGKAMTAKVPGFETDNMSLQGSSVSSRRVQPRELREGRNYTEDEEQRSARVAVIGPLVAEALFPNGKPLGQAIMVDGAEYTVIGVSEKAKGGFFGENGLDRAIVIPLSTARVRYPNADNFIINVRAVEGKRDQAFDEVQSTLRKIRRTPPGDNDFDISTPDQIIKQFDQVSGLIILASIAISGLGLLVGGIGVMNIMLVSVTERTREIGIRKALGARRFDIVLQFLTEAVALTGVGGAVGIVFSILVTLLVAALFPALPSETPLWAILAGVGVSVATGVFFGVWPAVKASRLDPVEALRYE